jgi:4-carboxymuconolactone decarboxylase
MDKKYLIIKQDLTNLITHPHFELSLEQRIIILLTVLSIKRKKKQLLILFEILKEKKYSRRRQYETILQMYLFAGFPLTLETLKLLNNVNPIRQTKNYSEDYNILYEKGIKNCRKVYGSKLEKLLENVSSFSPELSNWLIIEGYGKIFSRKILSFQEREIIAVATLSLLKYKDQLYSHLNGAFRAKISLHKLNNILDYINLIDPKTGVNFARKILLQFSFNRGLEINN